MKYIEGIDRNQYMLLPNRVEDYVSDNSLPVLIDEYVGSLDMNRLKFEGREDKSSGRPSYSPKDMLKLYIYGLMNNIRSSRKLERETYRNIELMWLLRRVNPDHKSISEFRRKNTEGIINVSKGFIKFCGKCDLLGGERIAIDGTKIKASNAKDKNYTAEKIKIQEERAEKRAREYEKMLEESEKEGKEEEVRGIKEKIEEIKKKKERYKAIKEEMEKAGESQISLTDKDSRKMKTKDGHMMAYNSQAVVDDKNRLIVAFEVTNEGSDRNQLLNMTEKAKEELGTEKLEVIADTGYSNGPEIKELEEKGATVYIAVPKPDETKRGEGTEYTKDKFKYEKEKNVYICPCEKEVKYKHLKREHGKVFFVYKCEECVECNKKEKCTSGNSRAVHRWEHEEVMERMEERVKAHPEKMSLRKGMIEHVFGCIKSAYNQGYFLLRGKAKVSCEFAMSVLTHNMKRCISLLGIQKMREMI